MFIRRADDEKKSSFFDGITPSQLPYVLVRAIGATLSHLFVLMAMRLLSISKVILILENPFMTSVLAYLFIGEKITKHEILAFCLVTVGIVLISQDDEAKSTHHKSVPD